MVLSAAEYLDDETVLKHLPWILPEEVPNILKRRDEADLQRMGAMEKQLQMIQQQQQEPGSQNQQPEE